MADGGRGYNFKEFCLFLYLPYLYGAGRSGLWTPQPGCGGQGPLMGIGSHHPPMFELRSSGLATSTFTCWVILLASKGVAILKQGKEGRHGGESDI